MRKKLGIYLIGLTLFGLGIWAIFVTAPEIEDHVAESAQLSTEGSMHGVKSEVDGRDITLKGLAQDAAERDRLIENAMAASGRRVVIDELEVLEIADPYLFDAEKTTSGVALRGNIPFETERAKLIEAFGANADDLVLSAGRPNEAWSEAVMIAPAILDLLQTGRVAFANTDVEISGNASDPYLAEELAALTRNLPEGYASQINVSVPITSPYVFDAQKEEEQTVYSAMSPSRTVEAEIAALIPEDWTGSITAASGAPDEAWSDAVRALSEAVSLTKAAEARIEDRNVFLVADAPTLEVQDEIEAALAKLPDGYQIVRLDISVPPSVPYIFAGFKSSEGLSYSGYVPTNAVREQIAAFIGDDAAAALERRFGMPDGFWPEFVREGVATLGAMESGQISIEDRTLRVTGRVANPVIAQAIEAALSDLPAGYAAEFELELEDDGQPSFLALAYEPEKPLSVSGKAPDGLNNKIILETLGLNEVSGEARPSVLAGSEFYVEKLAALRGVLPDYKLLNVTFSETEAKISGVGQPGRTIDELTAALVAIFGEATDAEIQETPDDVPEGTVRQNELTGFLEVFRLGAWQQFNSEQELIANCSERITSELAEAKIEFATGSAEIDNESNTLLDRLAEIIGPCLENSTAMIELGGHTDNQGSPAANLALSEARAFAVRDALLERGITATRITALGFGQTTPIASNDTAEGRAQNRRTTFTWTAQ